MQNSQRKCSHMSKSSPCGITKHTLTNGLTILVKPHHIVPEVDIQLWYNVGSKDEHDSERGMAHLIEHMIFKGTDMLSEGDLDGVVQRCAGYANAFTSFDYTTYVFRFPSNAWQYAFQMLADCMTNARFNEQMLNSEFKAVIQELKMYRDNYQSLLIEEMMATILKPHPYFHPIIGYKQDLWSLERDNLFSFYKHHYHPGNATLVVVGDVDPAQVIAQAQHWFGAIPAQVGYKKQPLAMPEGDVQTLVTMQRDVTQASCLYSYKVPGLCEKQAHLTDLVALLLARGKSSWLYQRLVDDLQIATDVQCFDYGLFDTQLLFIAVVPTSESVIPAIEEEIATALERLTRQGPEDWELAMLRKKVQMDYVSLLENGEQTAYTLGQMYLATGSEDYFCNYLEHVDAVTKKDLRAFATQYLQPAMQHKGYLVPIDPDQIPHMQKMQEESDALDVAILEKRPRTLPVEEIRFAATVLPPPPVEFSFPKPQSAMLSNGIEVLWYHNATAPKIAVELKLKANFLYDDLAHEGLSSFHASMLLEGTRQYNAHTFHQLLEERGIDMETASGVIGAECLRDDLELLLSLIGSMILAPAFPEEAVEKVRVGMLSDIKEYWDTPNAFISQIARKTVYGNHPYAHSTMGTPETITAITRAQIQGYHDRYYSPQGAVLVVVGDLTNYKDQADLLTLIERHLGSWHGPIIPDLTFPALQYQPAQSVRYPLQRDQVVLGFVAPSVARKDPAYDALALLDVIITGTPGGSMSSRLFKLREQTGLFYTVGGSLAYGASVAPGMVFLKTIVSCENVETATKAILDVLKTVAQHGVTHDELEIAKKVLIQAAVGNFESNAKIAAAFLFIKKYNFSFDIFDKRGVILSIIKIEDVHAVAKAFCDVTHLSTIRIGRKI